MVLGYLLARAGIETVILEKHADFLRDFRGDTIHPSTLEVMDELGLIDRFLQLPHQNLETLGARIGDETFTVADFRRSGLKYPYIAFMPQWDFLNFLASEGRRFPTFKLLMQTEATDLINVNGTVAGVRATMPGGESQIHAPLTVACDGRHSTLREKAGLAVQDIGAPMDVLWFRVGKKAGSSDHLLGRIGTGKMMITLDRGDYWQIAYVIPKGGFDGLKAGGVDAFRRDVVSLAPALADTIGDIAGWDDVKLLTVAVDRLERWTLPGLLCIGDAAHAMSPIGGVGVNLAVQDAVATANLLAEKLRRGGVTRADLDAVRARRMFPTRVTQAVQVAAQNNIVKSVLATSDAVISPPLLARLANRSSWLEGRIARAVGAGVRPEHVQTPDAFA